MKNDFVAAGIISVISLGLMFVHSYILNLVLNSALSNGVVAFIISVLTTFLALAVAIVAYSKIAGIEMSTIGTILVSGGAGLAKALAASIFAFPMVVGLIVTVAIMFVFVFVGLKVFGNNA